MLKQKKEIQTQRRKIDEIDKEIVKKIAERLKIAKKIGKIKKEYKMPILDNAREKIILKNVEKLAVKYGIDAKKTKNIFREILSLCRDM